MQEGSGGFRLKNLLPLILIMSTGSGHVGLAPIVLTGHPIQHLKTNQWCPNYALLQGMVEVHMGNRSQTRIILCISTMVLVHRQVMTSL